jgi:microcin C transport system permease protein
LIPDSLFAILLIAFAGGSFFILLGCAAHFRRLGAIPRYWKIIDYFWHLTLPLVSMALGAFATMTLLTKTRSSTRSASNMS